MFDVQMQELRDRKERERQEAIDRLQDEAKRAGGITDRLYWKMVYDFEIAPMTTNRKQLRVLGIEMPPLDEVADPGERVEILKLVLKGLAAHNIFVLEDDLLDDDPFYKKIFSCLDEEVREVPNEPGVREYIQFSGLEPITEHNRDWVPVAPPCID